MSQSGIITENTATGADIKNINAGGTNVSGDAGGIIYFADNAPLTWAGNNTTKTVTGTVAAATTTTTGVIEIATDAEAVAHTATDRAVVPSNLDDVFAEPPPLGSTTPNTVSWTTATVPINTGNTETHLDITPNTAMNASQVWHGIEIDGAALDPAGTGVDIHGISMDLSGVSLANDPELIGVNITMPATHSGEEEKAGLYVSGWGYIFEACSGDHDAAIRVLGEINQDFDGTATAAGQEVTVFDSIIQIGGSTGGEIHAYDVAIGGTGTAEVWGLGTHTGVGPVHQHIGAFGNADFAWVVTAGPTYTDRTAEFGSAAADVQIFVADNDEIIIGDIATFDEIQVILETTASQSIIPEFYYSIAGPAWTQFYPADDTNGFRQNGSIRFDAADLAGWAATLVNGQTFYWIRIVRTRNNIVTPPTEDTIRILSATEYFWDNTGTINVNDVFALTFDTNVAAAGVTLSGTTLSADGTDANIPITITPKGTEAVTIDGLDYPMADGNNGEAVITNGAGVLSIGVVPVAGGGTGAATFTDHAVLVGSGTAAITPVGPGAAGTVLIGNGAADPSFSANPTVTSLDASGDVEALTFTLDGIVGSYANSEQVSMQAGVQTTDAVATQIAAIALDSNTMVTVQARINGFKNDYSAACGGCLQYTARRAGAGAVEVAAPIVNVQEDSAGAPTVDADVNGNNVRLLVTGVAAETWNWVATYSYHFTQTNA